MRGCSAGFLLLCLGRTFADWSPTNNITYSCECDTQATCRIVEGVTTNALAWGRFDDSIEKFGWGQLFITTMGVSTFEEELNAFAAGFLEAALSQQRIWQHYRNFAGHFFNSSSNDIPPALVDFMTANENWVESKVNFTNRDPLWNSVNLIYAQLEGLAAGYKSATAQNPAQYLARENIFLLNLQGDIEDLLLAVNPSSRPGFQTMTTAEIQRYDLSHSHCSAIVKLTSDFSELFLGHSMWWSWYSMLPVFKQHCR